MGNNSPLLVAGLIDGLVIRNETLRLDNLSVPIDLSFLTPTVDGNTVTWTFPLTGISYSIQYVNDQLIDVFTVPESIKDAIFSAIPEGWGLEDTEIGIRYVISSGTTTTTIETSPGLITYRDNVTGKPLHWKVSQPVAHDQIQPNGLIPDRYWRNKEFEGSYYYDIVSAEVFGEETSSIVFNDTVTFGDRGGEDYSGTQDGRLQGPGSPWNTRNYGASTTTIAGCFNWFGTKVLYYPLFAFDLKAFDDAHPDATITGATLSLYATDRWGTATHTMSIYAILDDYGNPSGNWDVEEGTKAEATSATGEVCWTYEHYSTSSWTSGGAQSHTSGVDGDQASDYDGTNDRGDAVLASQTCVGVSQFYEWNFNSLGLDVLQYQKEHSGNRYGFIMMSNIH